MSSKPTSDAVGVAGIVPEPRLFSLKRVIDGDTYEGTCHASEESRLFGYLYRDKLVRLRPLRVDTPEINRAATREAGLWWMEFVKDWFSSSGVGPFWVDLYVKDSFGRWLCEVWDETRTRNLSDVILEEAIRRGEDLSADAEDQVREAMERD